MSKSNTWETGLLNLLFNNTTFSLVGDATGMVGSGTAGSLYVTLHTADPGETGDQTTSEATYTNYARVAVARTSGGWTISGNAVTNAAAINFPTGGASGNTITHVGIGTASSGASKLLYSGALTSNLAVSSGITPSFAIGALSVSED
jgi:hypothetical protein